MSRPLHSVSAIEGIGPAIEQRLQTNGVHTVDDLLRTTAEHIHMGVSGVASIDQVRGWQSMAELLQIYGMTGQWAEALYRAEVNRVSTLHSRDVAELGTIFTEAAAAGIIPDTPGQPDQATRFTMIRSALEIDLMGKLVGSVVDHQGGAVAGATLRIGSRKETTDARGRFRILRIPLGVSLRLTIQAGNLRTLDVEQPAILPYEQQLDLVRYSLMPLGPNEQPRNLDEFKGDWLPALTSHIMRSVRHDQVREGDVLVLHKFYKRTPDVLLASKFWKYEEGEFLVPTFKVAKDKLPADAKTRDHFRCTAGQFKPVRMTISRMNHEVNVRRAKSQLAGRLQPTSVLEWDDRIREFGTLLSQFTSEGN